MADSFDPLHKWLGIPPAEQPPHHYRLLGLQLFESDPDVIANGTDRQMAHVRTFQTGPQAAASQRLLNEISAAKLCLLKPDKRAEYDRALRRKLAEGAPVAAVKAPPAAVVARQPAAKPSAPEPSIWDDYDALPASVLTPIRASNKPPLMLMVAGGGVTVATLALILFLAFGGGGGEEALVVPPEIRAGRERPAMPRPSPSAPPAIAPAPAPPSRPGTVPSTEQYEKPAQGTSPVKVVINPPDTPFQPEVSYALRLDSGDDIEILNSRQFLDVSHEFTAEMWFRLEATRAGGSSFQYKRTLLGNGKSWTTHGRSTGLMAELVLEPNETSIYLQGALDRGVFDVSQRVSMTLGNDWHHFALGCDTKELRVFLDGHLCGADSIAGKKFLNAEDDLYIGPRTDTANQNVRCQVCAFRVSQAARYVENFPPPVSFQPDEKTVVLLDFSSYPRRRTIADQSGNFHIGKSNFAEWVEMRTGNPVARTFLRDDIELPRQQASGEPLGSSTAKSPSSTAAESQSPPQVIKRKMPDDAELADRRKKTREMHQVEFASANTPADKVRLAETLLRQAVDARDDDAGAYALWREALDLGADAGSWPVVSEATGSLDAAYDSDALPLLCAALVKLSGRARELSEKRAVANVALLVAGEAIDADEFDSARHLIALANGAAEAVRDAALRARATAKDAEITTWQQRQAAAQAAADRLKTAPDDRAANLTYGKYLCLVKRQWEQGLPLLFKSGDDRLKSAAEAELSKPTFSGDQISLGDTWWELAENEDAPEKFVLRERAGYWYQQAWPKIEKATAIGLEKRLMETRMPTTPAPERTAQLFVRGGSQPYPHTLTVQLGGPVSLKLRRVEAGSFLMGGSGAARKEQLHRVAIGRPYYLGVTEITQAQWERVMPGNPSVMQGDGRRPVETVSWDDCQTFVKRLNEAVASSAMRFRMPTEAEWEYACRAGSTTSYSFGDDPALLPQYAWLAANSAQSPHPVAQLLPNAWGFHDMYGNVAEWCYDFYSFDFYSSSVRLDPIGPPQGHSRVVRGESFKPDDPRRFRSFVRGDVRPDARDVQVGFRVACDVTGPVSGP